MNHWVWKCGERQKIIKMPPLKSWRYNLPFSSNSFLFLKTTYCLPLFRQKMRVEDLYLLETPSQWKQASHSLPKSVLLEVTPISQFDCSTGKMMHYVEDDNTSVSAYFWQSIFKHFPHFSFILQPSSASHQTPAFTFGEPIVFEIPVVPVVVDSHASRAASTNVPTALKVPASQPQVHSQVY